MNMRFSMPPRGERSRADGRQSCAVTGGSLRRWRSCPFWSRRVGERVCSLQGSISMPAIPIRSIFLASAAAITAALFFAAGRRSVRGQERRLRGRRIRRPAIAQWRDARAGREPDRRRRTSARCCSSTANISNSTSSHRPSGSGIMPLPARPMPQDITGGRRTPVWAEKTPDHRGSVLTSAVDDRQ